MNGPLVTALAITDRLFLAYWALSALALIGGRHSARILDHLEAIRPQLVPAEPRPPDLAAIFLPKLLKEMGGSH